MHLENKWVDFNFIYILINFFFYLTLKKYRQFETHTYNQNIHETVLRRNAILRTKWNRMNEYIKYNMHTNNIAIIQPLLIRFVLVLLQ